MLAMGVKLEFQDEDEAREHESEQQKLAFNVVDFLVHLVEERAWRLIKYPCLPPYRFAALLGGGAPAMQEIKEEWQFLEEMEQAALSDPSWDRLLKEAYILEWSAVRLAWMILEDAGWELTEEVLKWLHGLYKQINDTKVVEDSHNKLRTQANCD